MNLPKEIKDTHETVGAKFTANITGWYVFNNGEPVLLQAGETIEIPPPPNKVGG